MGRRRQRAAGRREGRCAERLASRELSLYELDTSVHAFVPTGGAREQRLCGRARGQDAVWGPRFTGGRARRRGGSPSCDPGVRSQTGGPVCKLGVCPARPGAGGCGQCPLLRPVPTTSSQKSPQGRSSPPPAQNHSSPWLRTPAWVLPPLPPSRASATSKEHARPTAQEGGAQNLTPNTQGPRPSRSGPAPLRGTRHLLQEEHPAEAGAADQNLPSGPGSSEPSAFQPALHPRGLQMVLGAHRPLASPPCHRSPRLGTQGLRGRPPARCPARRLWSTEPASVLKQLLNTFLFQEPGLRRASEWPRGGISPRARSG